MENFLKIKIIKINFDNLCWFALECLLWFVNCFLDFQSQLSQKQIRDIYYDYKKSIKFLIKELDNNLSLSLNFIKIYIT